MQKTTTTPWNYSQPYFPFRYFPSSTTPAAASDPNMQFPGNIEVLFYVIVTFIIDIMIVGMFFYFNSKKRCGNLFVRIGKMVAMWLNCAIIVCVVVRYYTMLMPCDDNMSCRFLNYLTIAIAYRMNLIYTLIAIEGISHNVLERKWYPHFSYRLLYSIILSLFFVTLNAVTGMVLIQNIYDCCVHGINYELLFDRATISWLFCLPHGIILGLLHINIEYMDHRHIVGGNYKTPAKYNEERDTAVWNKYDYASALSGLVSYSLFFYSGNKTLSCNSLICPGIGMILGQIARLFWNEKSKRNFVSGFRFTCLNMKPVVPHERHRRRNRMRQERAARIAANQIELEQIKPEDPVAEFDRNEVATCV